MSKLFFGILLIMAVSIGIALAQPELVKTDTYLTKAPLDLSGTNWDVFKNAYFKDEYVFLSLGAATWTPSQIAFMRDNADDGKPTGNMSPKQAFVGITWQNINKSA